MVTAATDKGNSSTWALRRRTTRDQHRSTIGSNCTTGGEGNIATTSGRRRTTINADSASMSSSATANDDISAIHTATTRTHVDGPGTCTSTAVHMHITALTGCGLASANGDIGTLCSTVATLHHNRSWTGCRTVTTSDNNITTREARSPTFNFNRTTLA
jgi:hypothetical protein